MVVCGRDKKGAAEEHVARGIGTLARLFSILMHRGDVGQRIFKFMLVASFVGLVPGTKYAKSLQTEELESKRLGPRLRGLDK